MLVFAWEGMVEGKKEEREKEREINAINVQIRITDKYAGYPARMLVFAWEGVVELTAIMPTLPVSFRHPFLCGIFSSEYNKTLISEWCCCC